MQTMETKTFPHQDWSTRTSDYLIWNQSRGLLFYLSNFIHRLIEAYQSVFFLFDLLYAIQVDTFDPVTACGTCEDALIV